MTSIFRLKTLVGCITPHTDLEGLAEQKSNVTADDAESCSIYFQRYSGSTICPHPVAYKFTLRRLEGVREISIMIDSHHGEANSFT